MKADLSRTTFDPIRHFRRVLVQQGRVQLDADSNEQAAILLHYLETLAADLIGPHGTPSAADGTTASTGFRVQPGPNLTGDFVIGPGHYYVDGVLCANTPPAGHPPVTYRTQPDLLPGAPANNRTFLVYLDAWERHITALEDDRIREVALDGPDTASRSQLVWQVKLTDTVPGSTKPLGPKTSPADIEAAWPAWLEAWEPARRGLLGARALQTAEDTEPCRTPPEARYRGAENQLYRVEIHRGGGAAGAAANVTPSPATFVWSRDNGSVTFPVRSNHGDEIVLYHLGRDERSTLHVDDWVELSDDHVVRECRTGDLRQVRAVDRDEMTVTLSSPTTTSHDAASTVHPVLRRWDHHGGRAALGEPTLADDGALVVEEGKWLALEDGVEVIFTPASATPGTAGPGQVYRTADYWTIPARTATGDVEWPRTPAPANTPVALPPEGVDHHFAPLAILRFGDTGSAVVPFDLRRRIIQLWAPA